MRSLAKALQLIYWLGALYLFGVVCLLYIHAHILFLLRGATVELAPYISEKEEGKGCLLVWSLFRPEWILCAPEGGCIFVRASM
jgi:hypothetical protein